MTASHVPERYPEIDIARGIAVVMMVLFHIAFDLSFLGIAGIPVSSLPWRAFAMATAALFLLLVGISLSISAGYAKTQLSRSDFILKYLKRGAGIFAIGINWDQYSHLDHSAGRIHRVRHPSPDRAFHRTESPLYRIFVAESPGRPCDHSCEPGGGSDAGRWLARLAGHSSPGLLQHRLYPGVPMARGSFDWSRSGCDPLSARRQEMGS